MRGRYQFLFFILVLRNGKNLLQNCSFSFYLRKSWQSHTLFTPKLRIPTASRAGVLENMNLLTTIIILSILMVNNGYFIIVYWY